MRLHAREQAAQLLHGRRQGVAVATQAFQRGVAGLDQLRAVGLAPVRGDQVGDRLRLQRLALQFAELVAEEIDAVGHVAGGVEQVALAQQQRPGARRLRDRGQLRLVAAEGVEEGQLAAARQQRLVLVLAVDLHQQRGQRAQLRQRGRAAVDPGARAAVGAQGAPQLAAAAIVELLLAQPGQRRGRAVERELGVQLGALGAVADHAAVGAQPGQEAQRVDDQRLAGAGFAGHDGEPRPELELGGGDDGEILDRQTLEHGA